jgi:nitrogen PTS system EIIA component
MARVSDFLTPQLIRVGLEATDKEEAIGELVGLFAAENPAANPHALVRALLAREHDGSTGIGMGVAVPHTKADWLDRAHLIVGISAKGVEWDALDGEPVYLVFLVLSPARQPGVHLTVLEAISRLLRSDTLRRFLMQAKSPEEVLEIIREAETGVPH